MIDPKCLLTDLQRRCTRLEDDLRARSEADAAMGATLRSEYDAARAAGRTAEAFEVWRDGVLTQAAVAWLLGCVFVRFLEDNGFIDPMISGPGERRQQAADEQEGYFRTKPTASDRDYLQSVFERVRQIKAMAPLYDPEHNPLWAYPISGDMAKELLLFWRSIVPETGELVHDFTDSEWRTRFLGDLYQDLSESVRKRYALLQTPEFVEEFILDRTLEPALEEFGIKETRLIDPTCGSGHFLLGAFDRLLDRWFKAEPSTPERELAQRALDGVYGVDLNPYAVAIAHFRLLIAALKVAGIKRLQDAPGFRINVTAGDSLLHGLRGQQDFFKDIQSLLKSGLAHAYKSENLGELNRILGQSYHAVVGNPPYITVKDPALNQAYRDRYSTCHMKYSLGVPFTQRFFELAIEAAGSSPAGYVGMITADSFMKREFGKKLIEAYLPRVDLTHVLGTSSAYIPGHGTPTVILFGRNRRAVAPVVRTVMPIKGEPSTPADPAQGLVWQEILNLVDRSDASGEFVSVSDVARETYRKHPWSLGGGGAVELKGLLEYNSKNTLEHIASAVGVMAVAGEDEVYFATAGYFKRIRCNANLLPLVSGDVVRNFRISTSSVAIFDYNRSIFVGQNNLDNHFWPYRTSLHQAIYFGKTKQERGMHWKEYAVLVKDKLNSAYSLTFAEVATHNHFVFDRGGKVFKQTAPVIKLPAGASVDDHLGLLGILNSSTACFWMKQVCFPKGGDHVGQEGARVRKTVWDERYAFASTAIGKFPLSEERPLDLTRKLDDLAQQLTTHLPAHLRQLDVPSSERLAEARVAHASINAQMRALQEELDWQCYQLYGLLSEPPLCENPPEIQLGERAFEIVMTRQIMAGQLETTWFERHGSTPIAELPAHWSEDYKAIVGQRIALIESDRNIGLIEKPEYKRRWNTPAWEDLEQQALREWLLDRLETPRYWVNEDLMPQTVHDLASKAQTDAEFLQVAELYVGHEGVDLRRLVAELVESECVPFLPVLRYRDSGLRHRAVWERTWDLQRREDAGVEVGNMPAPPKYKPADFLNATFWRLRGPLDVPRERFISYPHCSRDGDPSLLVGWAGWDQLQQARAITGYLTQIVTNEGWSAERLTPLFAGLQELIPWLKQWHNEIDPEYDQRMGDFFEGYLNEQIHLHQLTQADLKAWKPPISAVRRGRRASVSV